MGGAGRDSGFPGRPTRGSRSPVSPATPPRSGSARSSRRRRSGCPARWRSRSPASTRCRAVASSSASARVGSETEHAAYGIPFPDVGERFDNLEEQLAIVTGLWNTPPGETFRFDGQHCGAHDSPALPKPVQQSGADHRRRRRTSRTPALAARFATEFNLPFGTIERSPSNASRVIDGLRGDRPRPGDDRVLVGGSRGRRRDEAELAPGRGDRPLAEQLRRNGAAGTLDEAAATLRAWHEAGAERMYLQVLDLSDLDHLDVLAGHRSMN